MVITIIMRRELNPVTLIPSSTFRTIMLSETKAIDRPKERTILSMIFTRLKKTSVQAKPGRKKTSINPRIARMVGKRSRKGMANSSICLIAPSIPYIPSLLTFKLASR